MLTSALLMTLSLVLGGVALWQSNAIEEALQRISTDSLPGVYTIGKLDRLHLDLRGITLHHMGSPRPDVKAKKDAQAWEVENQIEATLNEYGAAVSGRDRELLHRIVGPLNAYIQACRKARALSLQNKTEEAAALYDTEADAARAELKKALTDAVEFKRNTAGQEGQAAVLAAGRGRIIVWIVLGLSLVSGALLAYLIVRSINRALMRAVSELAQTAKQVARAAGHVSSASQSLAQGASEQAASLQQTSASAGQINSMAGRNAENSRAASGLMSQSQRKFDDTNAKLDQMLTAMGAINNSSNKVSKIIKVIDEIAFQTTILALNAAVEAARAGEAGMGFAVVAEEVGNLAKRCAQAASDTTELIEESSGNSKDGQASMDQVAAAIQVIGEESAMAKTLVDQVSLDSKEQARGLEQISKAILQMERVMQSSAAGAEEGAAAARELKMQSVALEEVVDRLAAMVGTVGGR
jgi:methyl-accepting chemotaxis protein